MEYGQRGEQVQGSPEHYVAEMWRLLVMVYCLGYAHQGGERCDQAVMAPVPAKHEAICPPITR